VKLSDFYPLVAFVVPTLVVAYGVVIPRSCIAGWNAQSIGFATTILSACIAYWSGVRKARGVRKDGSQRAKT
jgi:ABC-type Fe3+ transport system permease subunit